MIPMAIPSFGGMVFAILTTFVVPIIYSIVQERKMNKLHLIKGKK
jgi:Cu(I)/Ag(I) efflux system membrane protein CusA/SilA